MTYFTKWLPVTGPSKVGDRLTIEGRKASTSRMFLCTRFLKPGDKLKECMPDGKEYTIHHFETVLPYGVYVMEPWPAEQEAWIPANEAFRVIGELSPAAVPHVKEGQEFTEDQVQLAVYSENIHLFDCKSLKELNEHGWYVVHRNNFTCKIICEIKCPWGHFH